MAYLTSDMSDLLTDVHLEALNKANIWTINDLFSMNLIDVKRATGISFNILRDIYEKVKNRYTIPCHDFNFILEKSIRECKMCPTGLPELTRALDGGFQTQEIVEFFGDSECGKTEMCYLLCGEILSHYDDYNILYVASNFDFNHAKVAKYARIKAGNQELDDETIFKYLSRIDIARPTKLADLVHLLNTLVHSDKRNFTKCIIIDSLSFIIQDDILDIKTSNLTDADELVKFSALSAKSFAPQESAGTVDMLKKDFIDIYLHEVMRLLTHIALSKNVIIVITNTDQHLAYSKSWTNAIDHRILLTKIPELSRYYIHNPGSTICKATIAKTIHNTSKIGYTIPFAINDEGLFAMRQKPENSDLDEL